MEYLLLEQTLLDSNLKLLWATETVTHRGKSDIQGQAHHKLAMGDVAAALNNVLGLDLESCRIVDLLEVSSEVALMIVLPLDEA